MSDFDASKLLMEADVLAKADGYISLLSMPAERRTQYTRAAKAVLGERERCALCVEAHTTPTFEDSPDEDYDLNAELRAIAGNIRRGAKPITS